MPVIGYAPGAYDLVHIGHLHLLKHAAAHCDRLIAGVVADEVLLQTKGRLPLVPLAERMEIVRSIRCVDDVHAEVVPDKLDTWRDVRFDVIFKGDDWRGTAKGAKLERDFAAVGVEVRYFPYTMHTSSTALRRALAALEGPAPGPEDGPGGRAGGSARRRSDMTVVGYAPGAYDLFHIGHLNVLRHAAAHCDHLVAGVVSDEMLLRSKGRPPVIPLAERMEIVGNLRCVDSVHAETVLDKIDTWREVGFDVIFKGDDWRGTPKGDRLERDFAAVGVRVHYFPYTMHTSSTQLRRALDALDGRARRREALTS